MPLIINYLIIQSIPTSQFTITKIVGSLRKLWLSTSGSQAELKPGNSKRRLKILAEYHKIRLWYWGFRKEISRRQQEVFWAFKNCSLATAVKYTLWITFDFLNSNFKPTRSFWNGTPTILSICNQNSLERLTFPLNDVSLYTFYQIFVARMYFIKLPFTPQTIVDLGANIGFASRWLLQEYPNALLVALEPEPKNLSFLKANLSCYKNAKIFPGCIYSCNTEVKLLISDRSDCHRIDTNENSGQYIDVPTIDIPTLMKEYGLVEIDFLKMDIEGGEKDLFSHCEEWIRKIKCLAIEIHPSVFSLSDLQKLMKDNGFNLIVNTKPEFNRIVFCQRY